jgi:hypothetical protein
MRLRVRGKICSEYLTFSLWADRSAPWPFKRLARAMLRHAYGKYLTHMRLDIRAALAGRSMSTAGARTKPAAGNAGR